MDLELQRIITQTLNKFPEVTWDRFSVGFDIGLDFVWIFGWVDREDNYKDFVVLDFNGKKPTCVSTSSAKYSKEFSDRLRFTHTDCQRVEDVFKKVKSIHI